MVGTTASSMARGGMNHGGLWFGPVSHVLVSLDWFGMVKATTTLSVSERAAASVAEWDESVAMLGGASRVAVGFVDACYGVIVQATTIVMARRPINAAVVGCFCLGASW